RRRTGAVVLPGAHAYLDEIEENLAVYFSGKDREFSVPVVLHGSPFERSVWEALQEIPAGETRSYGKLAATIGRPQAVRAVGRANGKNCLAIIVPCHRVIGADGKLTGYGGGLWRKQWLLEHERRQND
ncbi:MAG: methylated-DNA--[protein]-cysteine S-methyltransferase, partial [Saprospiraceae bacterium]|nr:methylated-DNA--[protein]-cysteine S-methyltransferase [Saprospiraceae bacterium]